MYYIYLLYIHIHVYYRPNLTLSKHPGSVGKHQNTAVVTHSPLQMYNYDGGSPKPVFFLPLPLVFPADEAFCSFHSAGISALFCRNESLSHPLHGAASLAPKRLLSSFLEQGSEGPAGLTDRLRTFLHRQEKQLQPFCLQASR